MTRSEGNAVPVLVYGAVRVHQPLQDSQPLLDRGCLVPLGDEFRVGCHPPKAEIAQSADHWIPPRTSGRARQPDEVVASIREPTSPWSSRCIGCSVARSSKISLETFCWPSVRVKGSRASKASSSPSGRGAAGHGGQLACRRAGGGPGRPGGRTPRPTSGGRGRPRRPPWCAAGGSSAGPRGAGRGRGPRAARPAAGRRPRWPLGSDRVDRLGDLPGLQLRGGRIDRDQGSGPGSLSTAASSAVRRRSSSYVGVGELQLAVEDGHLAGEHRAACRAAGPCAACGRPGRRRPVGAGRCRP